ncbi:MAG: DNA gyrase/topoisomerase IV subunit A [Bacteroidota bacterium]
MENQENIPEELASENIEQSGEENKGTIAYIGGMYQDWFLDYASYVILERAVPYAEDGLKPVQRRLLHAMYEMDDGRYNKVANIIGTTMKYHPHGDASIGDALVQMGQKDLLIDMQGNWGNIFTGDSAAAPRYIEARLSKFALDVAFNPKTTPWKQSYDGRNREPITLPMKFPLLLAQGVEGIAVGLASKILPHNFNELIDASIEILKGGNCNIMPDFPTGGLADFSRYNGGLRGGKVRIRAKINQVDKKTLSITEIPFGTTTTSLIESIVAANDKGKIKIKKIEDNTAEKVEILIYLHNDISADITIDALYAFTNCEMSISPNSCIIQNDTPRFADVNDILKDNTKQTLELLRTELQIQKAELTESLNFASLEKIFINHEMYIDFKLYSNKETLYEYLYKQFEPFKAELFREITDQDLHKLTQIPMIRITRFDSTKADEAIARLQDAIAEVQNHLDNIVDFAINFFKQIKKKYGKGKERKTEIRQFDTIQATEVAVNNAKLYFNREEGFAGTSMNKFEYICDCSDIDDIIIFREDGTFFVTKVSDKFYTGNNVIHIAVFKKNDERTVYNMIYRDGMTGPIMVKRFSVTGITRDKEYDLTKGEKNSKTLYFTANPNGEAEIIKIFLKPRPKLKKTIFDFDFSEIAIKGRSAQGNILSRFSIHKIVLKEEGVSTLGARYIWFDETTKRLNTEQYGKYLGEFEANDKILGVYKSGVYKIYPHDLSCHFDDDLLLIEKFNPKKTFTAIYIDGDLKIHYIKRFEFETTDKKTCFISESNGSELVEICGDKYPRLEISFKKDKEKAPDNEIIEVAEFIGAKSVKAKGKRLTNGKPNKIVFIEPIIVEEEIVEVKNIEDEEPKDSGDDADIQQIALEF